MLPADPLVQRIRRYMAARDLSVLQAGELLDVGERFLQRILSEGQPTVSRTLIDRVCHKLGIHPAELYTGRW